MSTTMGAMQKLTAGDPETRSADLVAGNVERLRELFPEAFAEDGIDFEVLRQLLGGQVNEREEKYGLNWHGKRRARQLALTPSLGTLRPAPEESVDWDTTQNLMIEGDNLEVLKLLQKSYAGKVKLIYIDPPYNTGKDFVYPDDFRDSIRNYHELTSQVDESGRKLTSNTEASGRFHTDWLNMMYPRLKLARNLLRKDGVIFISIDDTELSNLRKCCDELFGEENFLATIIWEKRVTRENRKVFSTRHDYVVLYVRDVEEIAAAIGLLPMTEEAIERYANPDNDPRGVWTSVPAIAQAGHGTTSQFYDLITPSGRRVTLPSGSCWRYTKARMEEEIKLGNIWFGKDGGGVPRIKKFLDQGRQGLTPETIWWAKDVGTNDTAKRALVQIFDGLAVFDTPKPVELLGTVLRIGSGPDDIVCDFFAGSAPTAHAVLQTNVQDSGTRRFISVQLDEACLQDSEAYKAGLTTIAEIGKERIRRLGSRIKKDTPLISVDVGFRVFKLDSSNIRTWEPDADDLDQTLLDNVEHIKPDRSEQDVLYELLLKLGLDLCVPMEQRTIAGKTVHSVGGGVLLACMAERISRDDVEPLGTGMVAWHRELGTVGDVTCVFRDSAFADDVAKTNLAAILEQQGLRNVRSL